jgi:hypothetical protein
MNRLETDSQIIESQDFAAPKPVGMFAIDLDQRLAEFEAKHGKGIDYEFQQLGRELEPIFGKRIWAMFHEPKGTEANVRRAYDICKQRGIVTFAYFRGVLKRL